MQNLFDASKHTAELTRQKPSVLSGINVKYSKHNAAMRSLQFQFSQIIIIVYICIAPPAFHCKFIPDGKKRSVDSSIAFVLQELNAFCQQAFLE